MSTKYKAKDQNAAYFISLTIVDWIAIFTRLRCKYLIINSLAYCIKVKGLEVFAYCIMTSHVHLLCRAEEGYNLSDILGISRIIPPKKSFIS